jgi:hypothetical protein
MLTQKVSLYSKEVSTILVQIWIPNLIFNNSIADAYVEGDVLSSVRVLRKSHPIVNSISDLEEKYLYKGSENSFIYTRHTFFIHKQVIPEGLHKLSLVLT